MASQGRAAPDYQVRQRLFTADITAGSVVCINNLDIFISHQRSVKAGGYHDRAVARISGALSAQQNAETGKVSAFGRKSCTQLDNSKYSISLRYQKNKQRLFLYITPRQKRRRSLWNWGSILLFAACGDHRLTQPERYPWMTTLPAR